MLFVFATLALAKSASANEPNNRFGIHIVDENDLPEAASLVNSNGGEWGYVTVVIREDERDSARWQAAFDQMRRLKLIPIVRLATKMNNSHWEIPRDEEAINWASFLNSLNWPVKNRYIVLFNEPNHAKEWGGAIDPAGFARTIRTYRNTLKEFSPDFFVMAGALDLAAPNSTVTMEASRFFDQMHSEDNFIFTLFDGLASHSYPNPNFSGAVSDSGKTSIRGYRWEIDYLSNFGMSPDIPVFITETGWTNENTNLEDNYKTAFQEVWNDPRVIAVTPFILSYTSPPFTGFSWKNPQTKEFYPHFYSVQSLAKTKGEPAQLHALEFLGNNIPEFLVGESEYSFTINIKNIGQSIWNPEDGFKLIAESTMKPENLTPSNIPPTEPGQIAKIPVKFVTDEPRGIHTVKFSLSKNGEKIGDAGTSSFTLVSPLSVNIMAAFIGKNKPNVSLTMLDGNTPITRFENLTFTNGRVSISAIKGVIPNKTYRFELSKPFYLTATREAKLLVGTTTINFGTLFPVKYLFLYFANPLQTVVNFL